MEFSRFFEKKGSLLQQLSQDHPYMINQNQMQVRTLNLLKRRVENILLVLADSLQDLRMSETHFFNQRESYKAVNHHVLELSML